MKLNEIEMIKHMLLQLEARGYKEPSFCYEDPHKWTFRSDINDEDTLFLDVTKVDGGITACVFRDLESEEKKYRLDFYLEITNGGYENV